MSDNTTQQSSTDDLFRDLRVANEKSRKEIRKMNHKIKSQLDELRDKTKTLKENNTTTIIHNPNGEDVELDFLYTPHDSIVIKNTIFTEWSITDDLISANSKIIVRHIYLDSRMSFSTIPDLSQE